MAEKHFYEQKEFTSKYLLPYFQKNINDFETKKVLEIGCAEGGLLEDMEANGNYAVGIELSEERAAIAKEINPQLKVIVGDVTDLNLPKKLNEKFDLIIMREVIEHVMDKTAAFDNLNALLKDNGYLFISFPPKRSPFAGHQQIGKSFLKAIPYLHVLPKPLLKTVAKMFRESDGYIDEIKMHFSTGCTIKEFEKQSARVKLQSIIKELYFFRPIYALRFGLPKIKLPNIPIVREYISFGCECLMKKTTYQ